MARTITKFGLLFILASLLVACSTLSGVPQTPKLSVAKVVPVKLGLASQVLRFTLDANNPNTFALPVERIKFKTRLSGIEMGEGDTTEAVTLEPNGVTQFNIDVKTELSKVLKNVGQALMTDGLNLEYELDGEMIFQDTGRFAGQKLPFKLSGNLMDKG